MSRPCASSSLRALPASDRWMSKNEASGVCGSACVMGSTFCVDIDLCLEKPLVVQDLSFWAFPPYVLAPREQCSGSSFPSSLQIERLARRNVKPRHLPSGISAAQKTGQCCNASRIRPSVPHAFRSGLDTALDICVQFLTQSPPYFRYGVFS